MKKLSNVIKYLFLTIVILITTINISAQSTDKISPDLLSNQWQSKWITYPAISGYDFGVYLFRKTFTIDSEIKQFIIHVSADNRYKLYVNESYAGCGPARGSLLKWNFESIDIASFLKKGKNVITAIVWNFAGYRPAAQISSETGFILQGDSKVESIINTNNEWRVFCDSAYTPLSVNLNQYYVVGPGEKFDCKIHPWNWMQTAFNDTNWNNAKELENGRPLNSFRAYGEPTNHVLQPREIPFMEEKLQRFYKIRRSDLPDIPEQFLSGQKELTIPSHSKIKILFDQNNLTNAYPVLTFSKGKNSIIKLTYAESLFNDKLEKGNRNEVENKNIIGEQDIISCDGGDNRTFQTLWWRTFRYLEMDIETKDEPLIINDFHSIFTGYPFKENASFNCSDSVLNNIWKVGWHTQRLCAGETYFDCPYYEQLQYVGDTRIQSLISSYVSGDTRLMRNAIESIHDSHLPFGITQSRYPSYITQLIPTFSLIWVTMVNDYWMICNDKQFVKSMIPEIMDVLNWYESKIDTNGLLGRMEWWNFVDWVQYKNWENGTPPGIYNSNSSIISLQYVYTLQKAAAILNAFGLNEEASRYLKIAKSIKTAVIKNCYDKQIKLIADSPEKDNFSQHANVLAILTNTFPKKVQTEVFNKILFEKDIAQCSFYFNFYLTESLDQVGLSKQYPDMLEPWKQMLDKGLTTFAEKPDPTRSDCHAWSASPVYYMLSLICGIKPNEPGFKSVLIEPHLGRLNWIKGSMPHRLGTISISLKKVNQNNLSGEVILPEKLTGIFKWNGRNILLKGGINSILLK